MRILLTSHLPPHAGLAGRRLSRLWEVLSELHELRAVCAASHRDYPSNIRLVVCSADDPSADLPFELPTFSDDVPDGHSFLSLSNGRLADYREAFRSALDGEIEEFNPDIVHVQHLWIDGHLVLESGAPYVATSAWQEWDAAGEDDRFARYLRETAENAGRILTDDFELRTVLSRRFELAADRFAPASLAAEQLADLYRQVFAGRYGRVEH